MQGEGTSARSRLSPGLTLLQREHIAEREGLESHELPFGAATERLQQRQHCPALGAAESAPDTRHKRWRCREHQVSSENTARI